MKKEWKTGEIRQINGEWYQYVKGECKDCDLSKDSFYCDHLIKTNVCNSKDILKKLEKAGEIYAENGRLFQKYKVHKPIVGINENELNTIIAIETNQIKEDMEEKKLNLKPFDLQKAREGKPVYTRNGRKARIVCFDRVNAKPILALVRSTDGKGEDVFDYFVSGKRLANALESDLDLMMLPEKKEG